MVYGESRLTIAGFVLLALKQQAYVGRQEKGFGSTMLDARRVSIPFLLSMVPQCTPFVPKLLLKKG